MSVAGAGTVITLLCDAWLHNTKNLEAAPRSPMSLLGDHLIT